MFTPPQTLVDAIRDKSLIPFVGAGISVGAVHGLPKEQQFPNWPDLIGLLATRLDADQQKNDAAKVRETKDLLAAAELAVGALGRKAFLEEMRAAFDRARAPVGADLSATAAIWRLRSPFLMTTNYDPALGWPWEPTDMLRIHNDDPSLLATLDAAGGGRKRVWHLHGSIDRPDTIILTSDHYKKLYASTSETRLQYDNAFNKFRQLLATRPFLFLGYSLDEPLLRKLLIDVLDMTAKAAPRKYLLLRAGQATDAEKADFRDKYNVEVLEYSNFGAPLIEAINQMGVEAWGNTIDISNTVLTPDMRVLVTELLQEIQGLVVAPAEISRLYNASKPAGWNRALNGGDGVTMLSQAIVALSQALSTSMNAPPPLLHFIERLRAIVGEPWSTRFTQWRDRALLRLAPDPAIRSQMEQTLASAQSDVVDAPEHVLVQIDPDDVKNEWVARAWAWTGTKLPESLFGAAGLRIPAGDSGEVVYALLEQLELRNVDPTAATLAFLVPSRIAVEGIHRWRLAGGGMTDPPIGATYTVTVQPLERFARRPLFRRRYRDSWQAFKQRAADMLALLDPTSPVPLSSVPAYLIDTASAMRPDVVTPFGTAGARCIVLSEAPSAASLAALQTLIETPTPAILWCDDESALVSWQTDVKRLLESGPISELPRRIRDDRLNAFSGKAGHQHATLMWDDTDHLPPDIAADTRVRVETI